MLIMRKNFSDIYQLARRLKQRVRKLFVRISSSQGSNLTIDWEPNTILSNTEKDYRFTHIASYVSRSNAGDVLLPAALRDLFVSECGGINWQSLHAYESVTPEIVEKINQSQGLIIGGGGLFLCDTNKNSISGWQWPCSIEHLESIKVPICVFAVGYNRFRGQEEFEDFFSENLRVLADKSVYIGLRNSGSIQAVRNYLPSELHSKVIFQPCMTTIVSLLYPHLFEKTETSAKPFIALNCAFDRSELRFGSRKKAVLTEIAVGVSQLAQKSGMALKYYSHYHKDLEMIPYLEENNIEFEVCDLSELSPEQIVSIYRKPSLVFGMRGHAQMIPFGCETPIISLVSHNKLQWFLDDIGQPHWSVDLSEDYIVDRIIEKGTQIMSSRSEVIEIIRQEQKKIWDISTKNVKCFLDAVSAE